MLDEKLGNKLWSETNDPGLFVIKDQPSQLRYLFGMGDADASSDEEFDFTESTKHVGREMGRFLKKSVHGLVCIQLIVDFTLIIKLHKVQNSV